MLVLELRRPPGGGATPGSERDAGSDAELDAGDERAIRCRSCGNRVSEAESRTAPTGAGSSFVFANPAGRVFELVTVAAARGVISVGEPTHEHTWFPGFAWRTILCASCHSHLGWRFDATSPPPFWGLIVSEISEG